MKVACYCGTDYEFDGFVGQCPNCPEFVTLPPVREEWFLKAVEEEVLDFIDSATKTDGPV